MEKSFPENLSIYSLFNCLIHMFFYLNYKFDLNIEQAVSWLSPEKQI